MFHHPNVRQIIIDDAPTGRSIESELSELRAKLDKIERESLGIREGSHARLVRALVSARTLRKDFLEPQLFADPAWDMLIELYAVHLQQKRISVSKLCVASGVPDTTALRWIDKLVQQGLAERRNDPLDGRRVWIELSDCGATKMRQYFDSLMANGVLARAGVGLGSDAIA